MNPVQSASPFQQILAQSNAVLHPEPPALSLRQRLSTATFKQTLERVRQTFPGALTPKFDARLTTARPNSTTFSAHLSFYNPLFLLTDPAGGQSNHIAFFGIFPDNPNVPSVRVTFTPTSPETAYLVEFNISMSPATNDQEWHFKLNTSLFNQPEAPYQFTGSPGYQTLSLIVPPLNTPSNTVELHPILDKNPATQKIPKTWAWLFHNVTITEFSK